MGLATKTQKYFFLPFYRSGQERVEESFLFSLLSYALTPTLSQREREFIYKILAHCNCVKA